MEYPIVIDNGAYECRAGFSSKPEPSLVFRNLVLKSRSRQKAVFVGEFDSTTDPSQLNPKSAFEHNLVTQLDVQETVFDHIFQKLCLESSSITNPIVFTEALCCPQKCRAQVTQLLLETYSVEKIAYFVDGISSYYSNFSSASDRTDTLLVSFGYHNTHVMAFSSPQFHPLGLIPPACRRLGVGGAHVAWYLQQLLALKYQCHAERLTTTVAEQLVRTLGRVAVNYREEMNKWTNESYCTTHTTKWNLEYSENSAKKANEAAERRQLQAERLRELHRRRHLEKVKLKRGEGEQEDDEGEQIMNRKQRRLATSKRVLHAPDNEDEEGEETESASLSPASSADEDEELEAEIEQNVSVTLSVAKVSLEQASLNKAKENCLLLRQKKAAELLASFALPAAVQAQITSATTTSTVGLTEEKMRRRTVAAADLEARRGKDYLLWLSDLRHKRQHLAKQRSARQSRIDFATELGLNAPPTAELTGNGVLKTENADSVATVVSLDRKTSRVEEGSLNERRQRQLEKIRAMAAELKPERGRGSRKPLNTGDRGRGARGARTSSKKLHRKDSSRSVIDSLNAEDSMDGNGSPSLLEEGVDNLEQQVNEDSKVTLLDDDFESIDCLDELETRAPLSHAEALKLPVSPSSVLPFSYGPNKCSRSTRARDAFDRLEDLSDLSESERDQLAVLDSVRALYDPEFVKDAGTTGLKVDIAEYYTFNIGAEPIRATEALFERSLIGSPQAGVSECFSWILRDSSVALYKDRSQAAWIPKRLFITGGLAHLPGMKERLQVELQQLLPWQENGPNLEVVVAADPSLDAWHGARKWSLTAMEKDVGFTTRSQYEECGLEYLVENEISNRFYGNTRDLELNPKFTSGRGRQPSMIN